MAGQTDTAKLNWPRWAQVLLIAVLVLLVAVRLVALADDAANRTGLIGEITSVGGAFAPDPDSPRNLRRVVSVVPGGPLDKAGVRIGDSIQTEPALVHLLRFPAGTKVTFVLDRGGKETRGQFTVELAQQGAAERQNNAWLALNKLAAIVTVLIGCFILLRGWGNKTAMLLGAGLIPLHVVSVTIPPLFGGQVASILFIRFTGFALILAYFLPVFAMRLYQESIGEVPRWLWRTVNFFVGYALLHSFAQILANATGIVIPYWLTGTAQGILNAQIGLGLCVAVLIAAWRNSKGTARNRNSVILFAFIAYLLGAVAGYALLDDNFVVANPAAAGPFAIFNALMAGLIAPSLLAYAVLRHKLFDLGFAVNRTLVYGALSVFLLASFALLEWAVKHLIPKEWYGGSAYFSAAIAVSLFLLFHRIHHFVEHAIERLFFHKWQLNEAALRRFVRAAAHVEKPEALGAMFAAELARFSGGANAAIYARGLGGAYVSDAGGEIDADDPALAAMRAEQGAVVPGEVSSSIPAALAMPMMHQAALAGFVALGPKATGEDYRPDEIEVLSWATQQVGLDLQAIRVRELELTNVKLAERNLTLSELLTARQAAT